MSAIIIRSLTDLSPKTLSVLALAAARDIDAGEDDKHDLLEHIMTAIKKEPRYGQSKRR